MSQDKQTRYESSMAAALGPMNEEEFKNLIRKEAEQRFKFFNEYPNARFQNLTLEEWIDMLREQYEQYRKWYKVQNKA
ncbi:hypothetical protein [Spirabiliibacterium falconis]|uniref:hypothetical protein n=1 Tax=Spirabiliibacterium falconis TaxID=572023 RepID=UPI001AAC4ED1|nr:hypothetical protein [Spirabiliibacterium falconis]MBE2893713.1 hypothetical protein [Spirabiliibacterium falconis]